MPAAAPIPSRLLSLSRRIRRRVEPLRMVNVNRGGPRVAKALLRRLEQLCDLRYRYPILCLSNGANHIANPARKFQILYRCSQVSMPSDQGQ